MRLPVLGAAADDDRANPHALAPIPGSNESHEPTPDSPISRIPRAVLGSDRHYLGPAFCAPSPVPLGTASVPPAFWFEFAIAMPAPPVASAPPIAGAVIAA